MFNYFIRSIIKAAFCFYCLFTFQTLAQQAKLDLLKESKEKVVIYNSNGLPSYVIEILKAIAEESGETQITLSSKQRSVKKQVEVMLDYYITCEKIANLNDKNNCGIALAKRVYDRECHAGFEVYDGNATRIQNVNRMTKELTRSLIELGESRRCMNHVVIPNIETSIIAVDIKPSLISNHSKFYQAVLENENVILFYYPDIDGKPKSEVKDAAFHLGFERKHEK